MIAISPYVSPSRFFFPTDFPEFQFLRRIAVSPNASPSKMGDRDHGQGNRHRGERILGGTGSAICGAERGIKGVAGGGRGHGDAVQVEARGGTGGGGGGGRRRGEVGVRSFYVPSSSVASMYTAPTPTDKTQLRAKVPFAGARASLPLRIPSELTSGFTGSLPAMFGPQGEGGGGRGEGGGGVLLQTLQNFHRQRDLTFQEGRAWEGGSEGEGENGRQGGWAGGWGSASKGSTGGAGGGGGEMHTLAHGESSIRAVALLSRLAFSKVLFLVTLHRKCTRALTLRILY
jgi:hypothetical protein